MEATHGRTLLIQSKKRPDPQAIANLNDFHFREADTIPAGKVLSNRNISLHCIDHENQRVIFTETTSDDLFGLPFLYQAQHEGAVRLIAVPYEALYALADRLTINVSRVVFTYSTGRCGSTLVGKAFREIPCVETFLEPDVYTQLVGLRRSGQMHDAEIKKLISSCTKVLCASTTQDNRTDAWMFKFRGRVIQLGDLFYDVFPDAKVVFLYRNAVDYAKSGARALDLMARPERQALHSENIEVRSDFSLLDNRERAVEILAGKWVSTMDHCRRMQRLGIPMFTTRYEDVVASPLAVLTALLRYCDLPQPSRDLATKVLSRDSQEGTHLSRASVAENEGLRQEEIQLLCKAIQRLSKDLTPDFIIPGTFSSTTER